MADPNNIDELIYVIQDLISTIKDNTDAEKKSTDSEEKNADKEEKSSVDLGRALGDLEKSTRIGNIRLAATVQSMFSLQSMLQGLTAQQDKLVKSLARGGFEANVAAQAEVRNSFQNAGVKMSDGIESFSDVVDMGMGRFGNGLTVLAAQLKTLGVSNKQAIELTRFNTQVLGVNNDTSLMLTKSMVDTAMSFGESANSIVDATLKMRTALIGATNVFGAGTSVEIQEAVAQLGAGNEALRSSLTSLANSLFGGTMDALIKRQKLGVGDITGMGAAGIMQELQAAMASIRNLGGGVAGGQGSEALIQAMERNQFFNQEELNLSRQMATQTQAQRQLGLDEAVKNAKRFSFTQAWQVALFKVQNLALGTLGVVAQRLTPIMDLAVTVGAFAQIAGFVMNFIPAFRGIKALTMGIKAMSTGKKVGGVLTAAAIGTGAFAATASSDSPDFKSVGNQLMQGDRTFDQFMSQIKEAEEEQDKTAKAILDTQEQQTQIMRQASRRDERPPQALIEVRDSIREAVLGINEQVRVAQEGNSIMERDPVMGSRPFQRKEAGG